MIDNFILSSVIFDSGLKLKEPEYKSICESIESESFSLNKVVLEYKKKTSLEEGYSGFKLNDGENVLIDCSLFEQIEQLSIDKDKLAIFMSESKENIKTVIQKVLGI